jgi:hypothetical protein
MNPLFDNDDDFIEWFDRLFETSYRVVLPDAVLFGLSYEAACERMGYAIRAAGYGSWTPRILQGGKANYFVIDADGNEVIFGSIEIEE